MAEKTQTRRGPLGWVKRHKKLTIFLAILLVAALVLVNVLGKTDKAAADSYQFVRTTVLPKTTLSDTVSVTGTVKAGSSASVTASDSVKTYKVTAVNVAVGDTVRKGDVIATLDTTDVEKQIANAQLQLSDTRTDARKNYTQAVEDQTTNLATAQENLDKAQKNYDTLGMDDYYTSMASAANSGKTNREIVTDWYTRYAEEIAGYENTLANLNIQLTQAQQDGDTARADGLQGQIADYTNRENIAKGQCSIPEPGLQGFDAVSQTYNKIEQYRGAGAGAAVLSEQRDKRVPQRGQRRDEARAVPARGRHPDQSADRAGELHPDCHDGRHDHRAGRHGGRGVQRHGGHDSGCGQPDGGSHDPGQLRRQAQDRPAVQHHQRRHGRHRHRYPDPYRPCRQR